MRLDEHEAWDNAADDWFVTAGTPRFFGVDRVDMHVTMRLR